MRFADVPSLLKSWRTPIRSAAKRKKDAKRILEETMKEQFQPSSPAEMDGVDAKTPMGGNSTGGGEHQANRQKIRSGGSNTSKISSGEKPVSIIGALRQQFATHMSNVMGMSKSGGQMGSQKGGSKK